MPNGLTGGHGTSIPIKEREEKNRNVNNEVTISILSPEEMEREFARLGIKSKHQDKKPIPTLNEVREITQTCEELNDVEKLAGEAEVKRGRPSIPMPEKDEYLKLRASWVSREACAEHFNVNPSTLYGWLDKWKMKSRLAEDIAIADYRKRHGLDVEAEPVASKTCDICRKDLQGEDINSKVCKSCVNEIDKAIEVIKRDDTPSSDTLISSCSDDGIMVDKTIEEESKTAVSNQQTIMDVVNECAKQEVERMAKVSVETIKSKGDHAPVDYIVLKFPVYEVGTGPTDKMLKILEEAEELFTELEFKTGDRGRILHELFDLNQTILHWIAGDISQLIVGSREHRLDVLKSFMQYHNDKHIEKQSGYAADRGWEQFA